jgi:hypothetical protein
MKRALIAMFVAATVVAVLVLTGYAAPKAYQFTGTVKAADGGMLTVEKTAKETWQFEVPGGVKGGTAKVGDKVTVYYKMVATEIEAKPATATKTPPKK